MSVFTKIALIKIALRRCRKAGIPRRRHDTDILARILANTSDTRDFLKLFLWQAERRADILETIFARMSARMSLLVSASWNASLKRSLGLRRLVNRRALLAGTTARQGNLCILARRIQSCVPRHGLCHGRAHLLPAGRMKHSRPAALQTNYRSASSVQKTAADVASDRYARQPSDRPGPTVPPSTVAPRPAGLCPDFVRSQWRSGDRVDMVDKLCGLSGALRGSRDPTKTCPNWRSVAM